MLAAEYEIRAFKDLIGGMAQLSINFFCNNNAITVIITAFTNRY